VLAFKSITQFNGNAFKPPVRNYTVAITSKSMNLDLEVVKAKARVIARKRLSGAMLIQALQCINDDDVARYAVRKAIDDPFGEVEALRIIVMLCVDPAR
jgi:hypothetical protein